MMPGPDDQPLNSLDLDSEEHALTTLARRVVTHLDGEWEVQFQLYAGVVLTGPDDLRVVFTPYGDQTYDPHYFFIGTFTPTKRRAKRADRMSLFTLPSQIAAHLASTTIPEARLRIETARKQQARLHARDERRKEHIAQIAKLLDWNSTSYKCHSHNPYPSAKVGRRRGKNVPPPALEGHIGYDDDGTMHTHLAGLPEVLVDQIVELVAAHYAPPSQRRWPRKTPRFRAQAKSAGHTGAPE